MSLQSINLIDHLDRRQTLPYSSIHVAWASAATIVLMIVVCLVSWLYNIVQQRQITNIGQRVANLTSELTTLRSGIAINPTQQKKLEELRAAHRQKRELLTSLSKKHNADGNGFSGHLEGLGRQYIEGLWLQHIAVKADGSAIMLKGMMSEPSLLPRYLQGLSDEHVFSGLRFQLMKIEHDSEKSQQMHFEIAADNALQSETPGRQQS